MNLETSKWEEFVLANICDINYGNKFDNDKMSHNNPTVNFITRTSENNGVGDIVDYIDNITPYKAGDISVALGGSIGMCCLQVKPFYTGQNVAVLSFTEDVSIQAKLFFTEVFMYEVSGKFVAFGRELNKHIKTDLTICLPIQHNPDGSPVIDPDKTYSDEGYMPDWEFMDCYISSLHCEPLTTTRTASALPSLGIEKWEEFYIGNTNDHKGIFNLVKGTRLTKEDMTEGTTHFLGAIDSNNGIRDYIGQKPLCEAGCVTVNYNGSVGEAFYQDKPFWASDDVNSLYPTDWKISPCIGLFLATVIMADKYRFTYGRKWNSEKMVESIIRLPIQHDMSGNPIIDKTYKYSERGYIPDWQFMEDYINSLPYSDRIPNEVVEEKGHIILETRKIVA